MTWQPRPAQQVSIYFKDKSPASNETGDYEIEENDSSNTATELVDLNKTYNGFFNLNRDNDWFVFEMPEAGKTKGGLISEDTRNTAYYQICDKNKDIIVSGSNSRSNVMDDTRVIEQGEVVFLHIYSTLLEPRVPNNYSFKLEISPYVVSTPNNFVLSSKKAGFSASWTDMESKDKRHRWWSHNDK